jgi:hypothetical protein
MGTRSLTFVKDDTNHVVLNMYRQCDGYPSGIGTELYEFLKDIKMVDGIITKDNGKVANGAGCLAAQIVAHFKDGPGGVYLHNPSTKDCGQDYEYHITADTSGITVKVMEASWTGHRAKTLYQGDLEGFGAFCKKE